MSRNRRPASRSSSRPSAPKAKTAAKTTVTSKKASTSTPKATVPAPKVAAQKTAVKSKATANKRTTRPPRAAAPMRVGRPRRGRVVGPRMRVRRRGGILMSLLSTVWSFLTALLLIAYAISVDEINFIVFAAIFLGSIVLFVVLTTPIRRRRRRLASQLIDQVHNFGNNHNMQPPNFTQPDTTPPPAPQPTSQPTPVECPNCGAEPSLDPVCEFCGSKLR